MKAIFISRYGSPEVLSIKEVPLPQLQPHEVRIKVKAFGINFADILARLGLYPDAPKVPFVPGYEVAGIIEACGKEVKSFTVGMKVMAFTPFGGYGEYVAVPVKGVIPIPERVSMVEAAALPVVYATAYYSLCHMVRIRPGDKVLIQAAAGGVGLAAVQLAKREGAEIFGTVGSDEKVNYLKKLGVHHPINYRTEDLSARIREMTQGKGLDVILDSLGGDFIKQGMKLLSAGGRFINIGIASFTPQKKRNLLKVAWHVLNIPRLNPLTLLSQSKAFIGVNMKVIGDQKPELLAHILQNIVKLWSQGEISPVISKVFQFDQIREAHQYVQERKNIGKVVVEV